MTTTNPGGRLARSARRTPPPREHDAELPAVLVADPPWQPDDTLGARGAQAKYETIATDDICMLDVPPLAERSVLFLWRLASMQQDALTVARAWRFWPVAEVVWRKLRPCQTCAATGRVDAYRLGDLPEVLVPGTDNRCPACRGVGGRTFLDEEIGAEFPAWMGLGTTVRNAHETARSRTRSTGSWRRSTPGPARRASARARGAATPRASSRRRP